MSGILDALNNLGDLKEKVEDIVGSLKGENDSDAGEQVEGALGNLGEIAEKLGLDGIAEKLGGIEGLGDKIGDVQELADKFGGVEGIKEKLEEMGGIGNVLGSLGSLLGGKKEE
ncbi:MAG: hypothetical protein MJZ08_02015 [Bacteroidaceae bacterium]|nr:hypothetical protein [Bacteroidaceae bacterium]